MGLVQGKGINDMPRGWASENEWNKLVYRKWSKMLYRCYNEEFHKTNQTYIGCTVCERWLILSNFIEDVPLITGYDEERFLNGELELDKDKKKDENKHYVMKYCTWLPKPENHGLAMKGKQLSNEHKQKLSLANKGKQRSEETKQKMSEVHKGKQLSEETKLKMSKNNAKTMLGKLGSECPNSKKIAQYDKQTLELIKVWNSMHDVERELGIAPSNISQCCKGKRKSAGGYVWRYVGSEENEF